MPKSSNKKLNFHIISMATYGHGLSGGDRIWIELAKRIGQKHPVAVYLWEEGRNIAKREGLKNVDYILWSAKSWPNLGFFINYFARILIAVSHSFSLKLENPPTTIIYSASEFWQDSFPAVILKLRYPKITWIAAWYQTAPNPFIGFSEGRRESKHKLKALLYWLAQFPVKPLIKKFADKVIVNNENEKKQFPELAKKKDVMIMYGAVPLSRIKKYKRDFKRQTKIYDAVFQGRFHPQKGVVELIDIWKRVVKRIPDAKLAMIGDGSLMAEVVSKIKQYKLENNIKLFGYVFDGPKKYKIFSQSKIVVHPAFYDSGGMASAEAMAFGLPAVGFKLKAYKSYYPEGMLKVPTGNLDAFAEKVVYLLKDKKYRDKLGRQALKMIETNWSWEERAKSFLEKTQQV